MRQKALLSAVVALSFVVFANDAFAQGILYRCESAGGISIQGTPCPKGVSQRKIAIQKPADPVAAPDPQPAPEAADAPAAAPPQAAPPTAIRGPYDPYPMWQCMRADGSTYDSRDGVAGKQWVVKQVSDADAAAAGPAPLATPPKLHDHFVRPYAETATDADAAVADSSAPPPGAAPGQWVADECIQLTPQQACARFATRRDALRKQIYAAKPADRAQYAPEEQDLTSMLYAKCGGL